MTNNNLNKGIDDIEEFYILGIPIKTSIGDCHFLKVKDYPLFFGDLNLVSLTKQHYINELSKTNDTETLKELERLSLMDIVINFSEIFGAYTKVFDHFFKKEKSFFKIKDQEEFDYLRGLVLKLSCIKEEEVNPNPEIQRALERSRKVKAEEGGKTTFTDIVTSVATIKGESYDKVCSMTLYQLYMDYYRLSQKINYDTSTLIATVSEKVEIEGWNKHINMFEKEKHYITHDEFKKIGNKIK